MLLKIIFLKTEVNSKNRNPDPVSELPWRRVEVPEDDRQRTGSRSGQQTACDVKNNTFSNNCIKGKICVHEMNELWHFSVLCYVPVTSDMCEEIKTWILNKACTYLSEISGQINVQSLAKRIPTEVRIVE